jgi:hypothetical protein
MIKESPRVLKQCDNFPEESEERLAEFLMFDLASAPFSTRTSASWATNGNISVGVEMCPCFDLDCLVIERKQEDPCFKINAGCLYVIGVGLKAVHPESKSMQRAVVAVMVLKLFYHRNFSGRIISNPFQADKFTQVTVTVSVEYLNDWWLKY